MVRAIRQPIVLDELELVSGLRERRDDCVEVFLQRYRSLFHHCIGHFEAEHSAREDLFQDVVVYVLERLDQGSFDAERGSLGTWLYRVAWCRCVDLMRKAGSRRHSNLTSIGDKVPDRIDTSPSPGEVAGEGEISSIVQQALATLDEEERQLLQLRFVENATIQEIGEKLKMSVEQTKYRLKRASTSLRRVLLNDFAMEDAVR
jgi:RNA polymerase sigma-70 factor (ECF subfamily)